MKIKPLTHKMKNRVKEHGDEWVVIKKGGLSGDLLISPLPHSLKKEPYMTWVQPGKDVEVLR